MHGFSTPELLKDHKTLCQGTEAQREVFPYKDPVLKFYNLKKQLKTPFICYADAESILKEVKEPISSGIYKREKGEKTSKGDVTTRVYQEHIPYSFCYKIVGTDPGYNKDIVIWEGENVTVKFIEQLQKEADTIFKEYIAQPKPMITINT